MRELRRPYAPVRSIIRKPSAAEMYRPRPHTPLKPGKEEERPVAGLPHLKRFEVVSPADE